MRAGAAQFALLQPVTIGSWDCESKQVLFFALNLRLVAARYLLGLADFAEEMQEA